MKYTNITILALIISAMGFQSCKKEEKESLQGSILPTNFKIDVNSALNYSSFGSGKTEGMVGLASADTLNGNAIYHHLGTFIHIGQNSANIVSGIIGAIAMHNINQAMILSYTSNEDNRSKDLEVVENVSFEGNAYQYKLTISDALSAGNSDGGIGLQLFWNQSPIEGVAILKPRNINFNSTATVADAVARIDYSETGSMGYDKHMIVSIVDWPLPSPILAPYAMNNLKMFVGKTGNTLDVYGNSNHPNAHFFSGTTGYGWAFVASGRTDANIAVAEVGIPLNTLNSSNRAEILVDNSIKQVFTDQIYATWPNINPNDVSAYLTNTEAPGYFNAQGFSQAGTAPSALYLPLETRISNLTPYNTLEISNLDLQFQ